MLSGRFKGAQRARPGTPKVTARYR